MMKINDGGPAFPLDRENALQPVTDMGGDDLTSGMSLRDWFAGQALMGTLANPDISASAARCEVATDEFRSDVARASYKMADAMLAARATPTPNGGQSGE